MTTALVRVFINATGVDVPAGSTAIEAVRTWDAAVAQEIVAGTRRITDSRGLPTDGASVVAAGSIFRVVAMRERAGADAADL